MKEESKHADEHACEPQILSEADFDKLGDELVEAAKHGGLEVLGLCNLCNNIYIYKDTKSILFECKIINFVINLFC
jgi:hypothetical protein